MPKTVCDTGAQNTFFERTDKVTPPRSQRCMSDLEGENPLSGSRKRPVVRVRGLLRVFQG